MHGKIASVSFGPEWKPGEPYPEADLNVSNVNAAALLKALGLDTGSLIGTLDPDDLIERIHLALALDEGDFLEIGEEYSPYGTSQEPDGPMMVNYPRQEGYVQERLRQLLEVAQAAKRRGRMVTYAAKTKNLAQIKVASRWYEHLIGTHGGKWYWLVHPIVGYSRPTSDPDFDPEWDAEYDTSRVVWWGGPYNSHEAATNAMVRKQGNPGSGYGPASDPADDEIPESLWKQMTRQNKTGSRKIAHDSGDGKRIFHCPFDGGGQVVARSDGTTWCEFCHTAFTVQVQPEHPEMPQTIDGVPQQIPGMPGQINPPEGDTEGAEGEAGALPSTPEDTIGPNGTVPPGLTDQGAEEEPEEEPAGGGNQPPWLKKKRAATKTAQAVCPECNGTGALPPIGHTPHGSPIYNTDFKGRELEDCPYCGGEGTWEAYVEHSFEPYEAKKKTAYYLTDKGYALDEDKFLKHLAIKFADDPDDVLESFHAGTKSEI